MKTLSLTRLSTALFLGAAISACGGSGNGTGNGSGTAGNSGNASGGNGATDTPIVNGVATGRFVDSAVSGLEYVTATQSGTTDANGSYRYVPGETVTFSLGDITLPTITAESVITPLTVFNTDDITDVRVMNLARLLQTLDVDGNADNGIVLSNSASASATGLTLDFSSDSFDTQAGNLIANGGAAQTMLVEGIDALEHLQETLFQEGLEERPTEELANSGGGGPATHPLVGRSVEFSTVAHDVSGTLTVLDDRTLELSNFNYDGGGVVVYLYNGVDGNYTGPDSQRIGSLLNGRVFENETFTVTLPDGLTLDDFNGISVWCEPFNASFGDARF